jgi:hypothetical protein
MTSSAIPRMYHSVASLTPDGNIMVAGSNPNLDRSELQHGTEYRVEWVGPPYMKMNRPVVHDPPTALNYGQNLTLNVGIPPSTNNTRTIKGRLRSLVRPTNLTDMHFSGTDGSWLYNAHCSRE